MKRVKAIATMSTAILLVAMGFIPGTALGRPSVTATDQQVNASTTGLPPTQFQGEPSIAQNPTNPLNLVVGSFHRIGEPECTDATPSVSPGYFPPTFAGSSLGFFASFDGGKTFPCQGLIDLSSLGVYPKADPWVAFDSRGNAYYGALAYPFPPGHGHGLGVGMFVAKSTDGGCTWSGGARVTAAQAGLIVDKDSIAADAHASSPFRDNVYATWDQFWLHSDLIRFSRSTDGGQRWSPAVLVTPANDNKGFKTGPLIQVGPNGTVYVLWVEQLPVNPTLKMSISYDGGKTFPEAKKGLTVAEYGTEHSFQDPLPGAGFFPADFPSFVAAPDGTLYVSWPRRTSDHSVAMITKSTDGGTTWSSPAVAADVAGRSAFEVALAVDPTGKVNPVLNALDDVPPGTPPGAGVVHYDTYWVQSTDGGTTFTSPAQDQFGRLRPRCLGVHGRLSRRHVPLHRRLPLRGRRRRTRLHGVDRHSERLALPGDGRLPVRRRPGPRRDLSVPAELGQRRHLPRHGLVLGLRGFSPWSAVGADPRTVPCGLSPGSTPEAVARGPAGTTEGGWRWLRIHLLGR